MRLNEVNAALENPNVWNDPKRAQALGREKKLLENVVQTIDHLAGNDEATIKALVQRHLLFTGSERARRILENWATYLPRFVKVMPIEYKRALSEMAQEQARRGEAARNVGVRAND